MPVVSHVAAGKENACHLPSLAENFAEMWMKGKGSPYLLGQLIQCLRNASARGAG